MFLLSLNASQFPKNLFRLTDTHLQPNGLTALYSVYACTYMATLSDRCCNHSHVSVVMETDVMN